MIARDHRERESSVSKGLMTFIGLKRKFPVERTIRRATGG
jgi:hypothetical protein